MVLRVLQVEEVDVDTLEAPRLPGLEAVVERECRGKTAWIPAEPDWQVLV